MTEGTEGTEASEPAPEPVGERADRSDHTPHPRADPPASASSLARLGTYAALAALLAAMTWPVTWERGRDSFPLSPYPMFSRPLPTAEMTITYALGVETDATGGARHHLSPPLVGSSEVLQAGSILSRTVSRGPRAIRALCTQIAERVVRRGELGSVAEIRIVTGTYDAVAYLTGEDRSGREQIRGRCPVHRAPEAKP
jgi:hypothetical protein